MAALPIVLLHGYPFEPSMWEKVAAELSATGRILTPDLNQRDPQKAPKPPSLEALGDQIVRMLDAEGIVRVLVCGFSMGGYVSLAMAERHSGRLAGLALINSQCAADSTEAREGRRAMIQKIEKEGSAAAASAAIPKLFVRPDPALSAYAERGAQSAGASGLQWALEAMALRPDRTEVLRRLTVPRLILHSDADQFIAVAKAQQLAAQISEAKYVELHAIGHASPLQAPREVAQAVKELWQTCHA